MMSPNEIGAGQGVNSRGIILDGRQRRRYLKRNLIIGPLYSPAMQFLLAGASRFLTEVYRRCITR